MRKKSINFPKRRWKNWRKVVGITGALAGGKSTVLRLFRLKGAFTLEADKMVHQFLKKNRQVRRRLEKMFGPTILRKNGSLNRRKIARVVFSQARKREAVENLLHPLVWKKMKMELRRRKGQMSACDVPLLFEAGWDKKFDAIVTVKAGRKKRMRRALGDGLNKGDFLLREKAQWPMEKKIKKADFIIDNNGSLEETKRQVNAIWKTILQ